MTDIIDTLMDLHRQATTEHSHYYVAKCCMEAMEEIAALRKAVADEREACAKVAENYYRQSLFNSRIRSLGQDAADYIAAAIRARKP